MKSVFFLCTLLCVFLSVAVFANTELDYAIMIDAGSSGTRTFLYSWEHRSLEADAPFAPMSKPITQENWSKRSAQRLADFAKDPSKIADALDPTIEFAKKTLKDLGVDDFSEIPIYLGATAGVRLIPYSDRVALFTAIRAYYTKSDFKFESHYAKILSGEEEGFFGFLSVNYLNNIILPSKGDEPKELQPFGALDLGGASTQITFDSAGEDLLEHFFEYITPTYARYQLYTNSFLQYGADQWWDRLQAQIIQDDAPTDPTAPINNPCLYNGAEMEYISPSGTKYTFIGDMNKEKCLAHQVTLLKLDTLCLTDKCSINGVYQPPIPANTTFYAFSGFEKTITTYAPKVDQQTTPYKPSEFQDAYNSICGLTYPQIKEQYPDVLEQFLPRGCASLMYQFSLLRDAYKLDLDVASLYITEEIGETKISWTLGRMLYEVNISNYDRLTKEQLNFLAFGVAIATLSVSVLVLLVLLWKTWSKLSALNANTAHHHLKNISDEDSTLFSSTNGYV